MKQIVTTLLLLCSFTLFAQKAVIEFEKREHDFGEIMEADGPVSYDFVFTNTGDVPLILTNVRASCGCTTPTWTREPIAPNKSGSIKVRFDPRNRPNSFSKSITVNTNAEKPVTILTIKGKVVKKPTNPYAKYRYSIGDLKLLSPNVNLGNILNSDVIEKSIDIINTGNDPLTITVLQESKHITAKVEPATLNKDEAGKIIFTYDAGKKGEWDNVSDKLTISTSKGESNDLKISANIKEDFSSQKADNYIKSPVATFSENEINLGVIEKSSIHKHEFFIENTGKSNLIIRKIKTSDTSVTVDAKDIIKAGKKGKVTLTFQADEKVGQKVKVISFITNDPKNTISTYKVSGEIK